MSDSVTVSEAAEHLGIPQKAIYYAARMGRIPAFQLYPGATWRVSAEWVEKSAARSAGNTETKNG